MNAYNFLNYLKEKTGRQIPFHIKWMKYRDTVTKEDLNVEGSVDFSLNKELEFLPDNLIIGGNLRLSYTNIPELPRNLTVKGNLGLTSSKIERIPDDIKVGGPFFLNSTKNLKYLPPNLTAETIYLTSSELPALPDNLTVTDILSIQFTKISEIPNNLKARVFEIAGSELDRKYNEVQVRRMIEEKGGSVGRVHGSTGVAPKRKNITY